MDMNTVPPEQAVRTGNREHIHRFVHGHNVPRNRVIKISIKNSMGNLNDSKVVYSE